MYLRFGQDMFKCYFDMILNKNSLVVMELRSMCDPRNIASLSAFSELYAKKGLRMPEIGSFSFSGIIIIKQLVTQ